MPAKADYSGFIGIKKHMLIPISIVSIRETYGRKRNYFHCICDCGKYKDYPCSKFKVRDKMSCGCEKAKISGEKNFIDGRRKHKLYRTYKAIMQRCFNKKCNAYKWYGARGITVCERWIKSFTDFCNDMGEKPTKNHSIDRINNDGNYEPSNCKWSTAKEQMNNTRKSKK